MTDGGAEVVRPKCILAVSGSLRSASSNTILLQAAAALAAPGFEVLHYAGLGNLPHFNPDDDGEPAHPAVAGWRNQLRSASAVIFSTPEYAHGVPGVLKNALDWIVGSGELVHKPVAIFQASYRGTYAIASLAETLSVMTADLVNDAFATLSLTGTLRSPEQIHGDPETAQLLRQAVAALADRATIRDKEASKSIY